MEGEGGPIQWKAISENKSGKELAKRRIEEDIPRRIMTEGTTMSLLPWSSLGRLRLLVTLCCIVTVPGINSQPGEECRLANLSCCLLRFGHYIYCRLSIVRDRVSFWVRVRDSKLLRSNLNPNRRPNITLTLTIHSKNRLVETTNKLVDMCLTKTFG